MLGNISKLIAKTPGYVVSEANDLYRKSMQRLLFIIFGYLGLMWGLSTFMGSGAIAMGMWGFIIVFTFFYWQPSLGGLGALVEWMNKNDDPKSKSTWRLYLMVLIAAIVVGEAAITLHLLDVRYQFPIIVLVLFTYVLIALLTPGSDLDKWLPYIGFVMLAIAVMGTYHEMNPLTNAQREAKVIASNDVAIQDARLVAKLEHVHSIMQYAVKSKTTSHWSSQQLTVYGIRCGTNITNRSITLLELQEYWPTEYKVWLDSQQPLVAGGKKKEQTGAWWEFNNGKDVLVGLGLAHIIPLLLIPILIGTLSYKLVKVKTEKDGTKTETEVGSGKYKGLLWVITIVLVLYALFHYWDSPAVANVLGMDGASVQTKSRFVPSVSTLEYDKWIPQFRSVNQHKVIPQDAWHGRNVAIKKGSYVTDTLNLIVVFDPEDERLKINLTGNCATGTKLVPKVCDGYWHAGGGITGAFRLEWDRNGRYFLIKMYEEQLIRSSYHQLPIKELLVRNIANG